MSITKEQITGLILAGGMGSRMGGVDKGLQEFDGMPLAARVLQRIAPQVGALLINANRHYDDYARMGAPVVADLIEGYAGPLAGLQAGLARCDTEYLVSAPCDSPLLPADLVRTLANTLSEQQADAAVAVTGHGEQRRRHPVFLLVRSSMRDSLAAYLNDGGRKVDSWLRSLHCVEAQFDDEHAFSNANTREELSALSRRQAL